MLIRLREFVNKNPKDYYGKKAVEIFKRKLSEEGYFLTGIYHDTNVKEWRAKKKGELSPSLYLLVEVENEV